MDFCKENDELVLFDEAGSEGSSFHSSKADVAGIHNHSSIIGRVTMVKISPRGRVFAVNSEVTGAGGVGRGCGYGGGGNMITVSL